MASLAMANSIRFSGLLDWDYSSRSSAASDIGSCGCSCAFQDDGQMLCRWVFLLLYSLCMLLLVLL
uniref:Uncharacterized protein n=1 Tax=Fagus sylvatica TaxID=28930 RepID=A0A2N9FK60_FAGSY